MAWFRRRTAELFAHEHVVFYPSFAALTDEGTVWNMVVQGCVYDSRVPWIRRHPMLAFIRRAMRVERINEPLFHERMQTFLLRGREGRRLSVQSGAVRYELNASGVAGLFRHLCPVPRTEAEQLAIIGPFDSRWIRFQGVLPAGDQRIFSGDIQLVPPTGVSIISDVDDTLKISNVPNRRDLFQNTFARQFRAIPGMPELYRDCASLGASFHYVSGSPWQLFEPLHSFWSTAGLPAGSFHLKPFRLRDTARKIRGMSPQKAHKLAAIEPILSAFPQRKFVLVGDSGEQDPEIYGTLLRARPAQVAGIFIRNVRNQSPDDARFQRAFHDTPRERWTVYHDPSEVHASIRDLVHQHAVLPNWGPVSNADTAAGGPASNVAPEPAT